MNANEVISELVRFTINMGVAAIVVTLWYYGILDTLVLVVFTLATPFNHLAYITGRIVSERP